MKGFCGRLSKLSEIGAESKGRLRTVVFCVPGAQSVGSNKAPSIRLPYAATVLKGYAYARTAPVGAALIFDMNKNGASLWTDQDNRLRIAAGNNNGDTETFDEVVLDEDDRLDLDVDQVGSSTAGSDVTVELKVQL